MDIKDLEKEIWKNLDYSMRRMAVQYQRQKREDALLFGEHKYGNILSKDRPVKFSPQVVAIKRPHQYRATCNEH